MTPEPSSEPVPPAFFVPLDDDGAPGAGWEATALCRGPWDPGACHGGPPAALVTRAVERCEPDEDLPVCRLTVEILRPVPIGALTVTTEVVRPGRRVQLVAASVVADGQEVMRATALRIRRPPDDIELADADADPLGELPRPEAAPRLAWMRDEVGIGRGVELRSVRGDFFEAGDAVAWFRMTAPLVEGEEPTGLQRAALVGDFGNGLSRVLDLDSHWFINPDLSLSLHRHPEGEWIALDATTRIEPGAGAVAEGVLADARGRVGHATQHLYVAER